MKRSLPPFAAIRAFEVAAKLPNFKIAAEELNLSASAVSHQIRSLEEYLDIPLFVRKNGQAQLTLQGERYLHSISRALDELESATNSIKSTRGSKKVTINLDHSLLTCWLEPLVQDFRGQYPDTDIEFVGSDSPPDNKNKFDISLYFAQQPLSEVNTWVLLEDTITLVSSPALAGQIPAENQMEDIFSQTLLHCSCDLKEWDNWFAAYDINLPDNAGKLTFNDRAVVLNSAVRGVGVAIGRQPFLNQYLQNNSLLMPYSKRIKTGDNFYLTVTKSSIQNPIVKQFRLWLQAEANRLIDIGE